MSFNPGFGRPVPGSVKAQIISGWWRPRADHRHAGLDIPLITGTPILALADGTVIRAQATPAGATTAGIWVGLEHASGLVSRYMHMSRLDVSLGQRVRKGQQIGLSGNTGVTSTGPHLHLDLKAPAALLPAIQAAAGKPTTGWAPFQAPWGYGIPAEPWVQVDSYNARTIADAKANGVRLYKKGPSVLTLVAVAAISYGAYRLLS
jgi:murein DD-endopeptidase MepM/ murein hydrolase activator NlpD